MSRLGAFIDTLIEPFAPKRALARRKARTQFQLAGGMYRGADNTRLTMDWILGRDTSTPSNWELNALRQRTRDLNRNNPIASGATDTIAQNVVGTGLKPQSKLRADRLGISEEKANELRRQAESVWEEWCPIADAYDIQHFDDIQFMVLWKMVEDGELLVLPTWITDSWRPFGRAVEVLEIDRLKKPSGQKDVPETGIELDAMNRPFRYWIEKARKKPGDKIEFSGITKRDKMGRPKVLHIYNPKRPGQMRGVPHFAALVGLFKQLADYLEAEVVAARVAACLAVFVTHNEDALEEALAQADPELLEKMVTDRNSGRVQSIKPGMVSHLESGESIEVVDPRRPGDAFEPFVASMLRFMSMALGLSYEQLTKDFSKTNYSSARAALLEGRRMFKRWRTWLARKLCQPVWELVLEEAWLRGKFDAPDFYEKKHEYCRALWIGGGWGWVDPVKEVQSSDDAIAAGLSTLADECAAQGRDWEEVLEQRAREKAKAAELGLDLGIKAKKETKEEKEDA